MPTLRFKKELVTNADLAKTWAEFERAYRDSLGSPVWPNDLEALRSEGLKAGNKVLAEIYGPFKTAFKLTYQIVAVDPRKFFVYAPIQPHPFSGQAKVEFVSDTQGKTKILWTGDYRFKWLSLGALYYKLFFERRFFDALQRALSTL